MYNPEEDPRFLGEVFDQDEWRDHRKEEIDTAQDLERFGLLKSLYQHEAWPAFVTELVKLKLAHHDRLLAADSMQAVEQARTHIKALDAVLDMPRRNDINIERATERLQQLSEDQPAR